MNVHVLIGVWGGCTEEVQVFTDLARAKKEEADLKAKYEILPGLEAESPNQVILMEDLEVIK